MSRLLFVIIIILVTANGCSKNDEDNHKPKYIWDIDKDGIPKFVNNNYIELDNIYRISKFRSSVGHDYSDFTEHCRSMKHYFEPKGNTDWSTIKIYAPVSGTITRVEQEWAGTKIEIESEDYPAFRFQIFHINLNAQRNIGDKIQENELLGTHIGNDTYSDISVFVNDPTKQGRIVSYFDVITDEVFQLYINKGISSRLDIIIPKNVRDANPLTCNGDTFVTGDVLECWVELN